ncbi:hypothetical protein [Ochrobactrum sp. A-1]|uniref:hypothetical protein n=1 Tax=Ochrobactrum sp. A-1 TaxID=2920940 RepID=UPI001F0A1C47|nr:hypothetical protein [Ochrobactrum sp. A-1]
MCDPLTIAGIALTAGSTVANTMAANKVQNARDDAMAAERIRQQGLDQEAAALNTQSQDRYKDFGGQQEDKATQLGDYFAQQQIEAGNANDENTAAMIMPQSGSNIVVQEEAKQRGKARDFANQNAKNLGNLRSFGDLIGSIGRDQARDATQVGVIGGFKRGSSGILPYELEAANSAGNGMKMFGDILGLGGGLAVNAGLGGGSLPSFGGAAAAKTAPAGASSSLYSLYGNKTGLF